MRSGTGAKFWKVEALKDLGEFVPARTQQFVAYERESGREAGFGPFTVVEHKSFAINAKDIRGNERVFLVGTWQFGR